VPAQRSEDRDTLNVTPDMQALNQKIKELRKIDQEDAALDKLIQGEEFQKTTSAEYKKKRRSCYPAFEEVDLLTASRCPERRRHNLKLLCPDSLRLCPP